MFFHEGNEKTLYLKSFEWKFFSMMFSLFNFLIIFKR